VSDQVHALTRAERRRQTEDRILVAARDLFVRLGYERTTIRAIAAAAEVDPSLVMQYFGSKDRLFRQAASLPQDEDLTGDPEGLTEHLMTMLGLKLGGLPQASLTALRSALTHPEAAERVRQVQAHHVSQIGDSMAGEDAELRAALIVAIMLGVTIERHLIELGPLRDASYDEITELLRPCLETLTRPG
jgi:AcrR family transcriptional regulator